MKKYLGIFISVLSLSITSIKAQQPILEFGVFADCQYDDADESGARCYRTTKLRLDSSVMWLNSIKVPFTLSLGDLVHHSTSNYDTLMPVLAKFDSTVYYTLGNHELIGDTVGVWKRLDKLNFREPYYYTIDRNGVRLLVLDSNPGAFDEAQESWLRAKLEESRQRKEMVVVFSHHPLAHPLDRALSSTSPAIREIVTQYNDIVKVCFAGHFHYGGHAKSDGVDFYIIKGMVEKLTENYSQKITIFEDKIELLGIKGETKTFKFEPVE